MLSVEEKHECNFLLSSFAHITFKWNENLAKQNTQIGSQQWWPDMAKFLHLGNISKVFGHFLSNNLVFGKIVSLL